MISRWNFSTPYAVLMVKFELLPSLGDEVYVLTKDGILSAKYTKWDWSDSSETPYFEDEKGKEMSNLIAWCTK